MGPLMPIFGNFDENQTDRKQTSDISIQSLWTGEFENIICLAKYLKFAKYEKLYISRNL